MPRLQTFVQLGILQLQTVVLSFLPTLLQALTVCAAPADTFCTLRCGIWIRWG